MAKAEQIRAELERKMASEVAYPFGTTVRWTEGNVEEMGQVSGLVLKVRENPTNSDETIFFSDILHTELTEEALEKDVAFPTESDIRWKGAFMTRFGPTPGKQRRQGKVTGYKVLVDRPDGSWTIVELDRLTAHSNPGGFRKRQTKRARVRRSHSRRRR
jgi:hypothetical protein